MLRSAIRVLSSTARHSIFSPPIRTLGSVTACPYRVSESLKMAVDTKLIKERVASNPKIAAVLTDGAGTSGDSRGKGTKAAMTEVTENHFEKVGVQIIDPIYPIEEHNGTGKLPHFIKVLEWLRDNDRQVEKRYQANPHLLMQDAHAILNRLTTEGVKIIKDFSTPVPGFKQLAQKLKALEKFLILQTAYGKHEAEAFEDKMKEGGVIFDYRVTSSDVKNPRSFPAMLHKTLDYCKLFPWNCVVLGDTPADMMAALGFWSIGLPDHSAFLPSRDMSPEELHHERVRVANLLIQHGAHYVLLDADWRKPEPLDVKLFRVIEDIELRMSQGYFPEMLSQATPEFKSELKLGCR